MAGAAVVGPRRPVIATGRPVIATGAAVHGRRERRSGGGLALWRGTTERRPGRRDDPGWLRAHPQDAPAAGGQDLEVELVKPDRELLASVPKGLLDGLAGELTVRTHAQRFLPRRP
jgi:hypothetical protein